MIVGTLTELAAAPNGEALISESSAYFDKAKFPEFYEKTISKNGYATQSAKALLSGQPTT
jgi:hypothetical protein